MAIPVWLTCRRWRWTALPALAALCPPASAHGFGQRFDLPLPLWLWVTGAAATILLSFVVMALFVRTTLRRTPYPRVKLLNVRVGRWFAHPVSLAMMRIVAVVIFLTTILAGLLGTADPFRNLAPTMVWVVWWVGFAFVCALIGDLWALVNPLRSLFAWAEIGYARVTGGRQLSRQLAYPTRLGVWPAVIVFLVFTWGELVWLERDVPLKLALLMVAYAGWTWLGMYLYGREVWLQNGEAFAVAFGVLARFAPFEVRVADRAVIGACRNPGCRKKTSECVNGYVCLSQAPIDKKEWNLRPPAVGLLQDRMVQTSLMVFVLAMLSTVTFDGLVETPLWVDVTDRLLTAASLSPIFYATRTLGLQDSQLLSTIALIAMVLLFLSVYMLCNRAMAWVTARGTVATDGWQRANELARAFILTLVPIAIAYHLAHYLSMLLITGQFIIPLASDPLGLGWNLWGTADYKVDLSIVGARFVWYSAVAAIVLGHVAAVYLAHRVALDVFGDRRLALLSQIPMVVLMILYTMASLWILAQPIVG